MDILFLFFIYPIQQIIELCFYFVLRVFHNPTIAIFGVSIAVGFCTLPLYFRAECWQNAEREKNKLLAPKVKKIKTAFTGDEQFMILSTYYRQQHYHPLCTLRSSLGVLIQIPFFIAAYSYLSHLDALHGASFSFLKDLSESDKLIPIGLSGRGVNILPVLMTLINCVSGAIYTRGFTRKEKLQLYGMALIFLVLLYNSPSGLVLYWTANNIFSLAKNIFQKIKYSRKIIIALLYFSILSTDIYLIFFQNGDLPNRIFAMFVVSFFAVIPLVPNFVKSICTVPRNLPFSNLLIAGITLVILCGITIPSSLIATSVEEFSFIDLFTAPWAFIVRPFLQLTGIFVWLIALYFLFSRIVRQSLTLLLFIASIIMITQAFFVSEDFGFITNTLIFSDPKGFEAFSANAIVSILLFAAVLGISLLLYVTNKKKIISWLQTISLVAIATMSAVNCISIERGFETAIAKQKTATTTNSGDFEKVYRLSKDGNNVILIMLDCVVGSYIPYMFDERQDLLDSFTGFTLYENTVSFANHTLIGALPIYGGYEYTPKAVNSRTDATLLEKQTEAYLMLPTLFANAGYAVTVTDPPFDNRQLSNLSIFDSDKRITATNLSGKYTSQWLKQHDEVKTISVSDILLKKLIRFSFFKSSPLFLRPFLYDDGQWLMLKDNADRGITTTILNDYVLLDMLPNLSEVQDGIGTYNCIYVHLPHGTTHLNAPNYDLANSGGNVGNTILSDDERYQMTFASFLLLKQWFDFLKANDVYDNTRIILVSDHGRGNANYPENIALPDGNNLQSYNALLMVKDFDSRNNNAFSIDSTFMTNADAALIAAKDVALKNPFTANELLAGKENGVFVTTIGALSTYRHGKYGYNINTDQWLYVNKNIFDKDNWKNWNHFNE